MKLTIHLLFLLTLIAPMGCKTVVTAPIEESRIQHNPDVFPWIISKPAFSIAQIEGMELLDINGVRQKVPFGALNKTWAAFKALVKPGDEIHQWTNGDGGAPKGYCAIRNGRVAVAFTAIILVE